MLVVVGVKEDFLSIDWRLSGNFEKKGNVTSGNRNQTFSSLVPIPQINQACGYLRTLM